MVNSALAEPGEIAPAWASATRRDEPIAQGAVRDNRFQGSRFEGRRSDLRKKGRGETSISRVHHRSSVGPSFAPKVAQMPLGRPYPSAMDGSDPSTQGNVPAKAPRPPATRPAISPACV